MGRNRKNKLNQKNTTKPPSSNATKSKYHGLENQGATCYLNSVLQVLFMTKDFREAVSSSENSGPECIDSHLSTLFKALQNKTAKTQAITEHLKITRVSEQDDAAECFEKILSCSSPQALQVFQGLLTHRNTCSKCHTSTCNDQPFWSLPLPLVDSDKDYGVMQGIQHFFEESNISGENKMYCNQCGVKADASVKAEMKQRPQVLALLMKRFRFDYREMKYVKITQTVEIPFILPVPHNGGQIVAYELYACVQHSGDLKHGHYTVNIKPQDDKTWYNFNDTRVSSTSQMDCKNSSFRSKNAYLLFYRRSSAMHTQDISEVPISEGSTNGNEDKGEMHGQDVKTGNRKVNEEAADSQKSDKSNNKTKEKMPVIKNKDSKTPADHNSCTSANNKSRNQPSKSQQSSSKKVLNDVKLQERNSQNPSPDARSHRKQTPSQINQCSHQVRDKGEAAVYRQSKQSYDPHEEQNREEEDFKRQEDQQIAGESQELPNAIQHISHVSTLEHCCQSKQQEAESEEKVVNVREDRDSGTSVETLGDVEKMMEHQNRGSHRNDKKISLCNEQNQLKGEDSVAINTSGNNQEPKQVISDSGLIRRERCDGTEGSQDSGKLDEVCQNKLGDDQGQEVNRQVGKETKDLEPKCDPGANNTDTMLGLNNCGQSDLSEQNGNKNINGNNENNAEMKSLPELCAEKAEKVLLGPQIGANNDKSHDADRKGTKNKKGSNKNKKSVLNFGLSSPRKKY